MSGLIVGGKDAEKRETCGTDTYKADGKWDEVAELFFLAQ